MAPALTRALTAAALVPLAVGFALGLAGGAGAANVPFHAINLLAVAVACVIVSRCPTSPVGPALAWTVACVSLSMINDVLAASWYTADPLPLAGVSRHLWAGFWPVNLAGLLMLLLVFPSGRRRGTFWAAVPWLYVVATGAMVFALWDDRQLEGRVVGGQTGLQSTVGPIGAFLVAGCLVSAVVSVVLQYRSGDERRALQIRWLILAGGTVIVLLVAGWAAESLGASLGVAYGPFLGAVVLLIPAAVGIAMVRHDLFDVDRVLGTGGSWLLTLLVSAAVFGAVVVAVSSSLGEYAGLGPAAAAFVTALVLLPIHRHVVTTVGRVVDRDRHVAVATVERFAADVRTGKQPPERIEEVLQEAQGDPDLRLVLRHPDGRWVRLSGETVEAPSGIEIDVGGDTIAVVTLGWESARARRRIADLTRSAWVTIEVTRLRQVLREALDEVVSSQARLGEAAAAERRRLERDLHDGAQQRIVATGMRLRILQRHLDGSAEREVEAAVGELEDTVRELRELAHGVRPVRLSDGLGPALEIVRAASPVPMTLSVQEPRDLDEGRRLAAYLVVSEAVTNALKHAAASSIDVTVSEEDGGISIDVRDDGVGGVPELGLTALRDRVRSVGGRLRVESPVDVGTTVTAWL